MVILIKFCGGDSMASKTVISKCVFKTKQNKTGRYLIL